MTDSTTVVTCRSVYICGSIGEGCLCPENPLAPAMSGPCPLDSADPAYAAYACGYDDDARDCSMAGIASACIWKAGCD